MIRQCKRLHSASQTRFAAATARHSRSVESRAHSPGNSRDTKPLATHSKAVSGLAASKPASKTGWHPLEQPLIWQGSEDEAVFQGMLPVQLSPPWKVILLSDGSVTRHLQLMTDLKVHVDCLEMANIGEDREGLPMGAELIPGPLLQRQVLLRSPGPSQRALVYAASWWNADHVNEYLKDGSQPIWVSLSRERTELYREIQQVYHGNSPYLEEVFDTPGPFWGRQYLFWHNQQPLTLIYEVFSNSLEKYLGPCSAVI
ncbi:hypothetical protein WJX72_012138 [[Myrmecia] bisecta]|uniref:DUF98 domain-containing protein n=1 Tax=[Myrmecia] bisecta TaxID=41462 RepID=A0AAW1RBA6_9CHLO